VNVPADWNDLPPHRDHGRVGVEHPGRPVALAEFVEGQPTVSRTEELAARFVLECEDELQVRVTPIDRAPVDVDAGLVERAPRSRIGRRRDDRAAVDGSHHEALGLPGRVEHEAAGSLSAALEGCTKSFPGLALIDGAIDAAIADVDVDVPGRAVDRDAAETAVAWLFLAKQRFRLRFPVLRGGGDGKE
jgi:hypothetical protein